MSFNVMNMIGDIKARKRVGIVHAPAHTPREQRMYGRKDGATMGQHIDEFDNYRDDLGRSFDQIILEGLFYEPKNAMLPPPKPQVSNVPKKQGVVSQGKESGHETKEKDEAIMYQLNQIAVQQIKKRMVNESSTDGGGTKRKAEPETVVYSHETHMSYNDDNARKSPRVQAYFKA
ncbi:hypothetical protein HBI54_141480 [Parastagonospora nodorum]|nr:hypothetical protein HBI54_141480 [Parastagonospora nodorum]